MRVGLRSVAWAGIAFGVGFLLLVDLKEGVFACIIVLTLLTH